MLIINQNTNLKVVILKKLIHISMWKSLKLSMNMWSTKKNHRVSTNRLNVNNPLKTWMLNRRSPGLVSCSKVPLEELLVCWILCSTKGKLFTLKIQNAFYTLIFNFHFNFTKSMKYVHVFPILLHQGGYKIRNQSNRRNP